MSKFRYIRDEHRVYERVGEDDHFTPIGIHKSISSAKHWTNAKEKEQKGCVRRRESLERLLGPKKVKEMLREQ